MPTSSVYFSEMVSITNPKPRRSLNRGMLAYFSSHYLGLGFGLSAGMMASACNNPILVGAQDAFELGSLAGFRGTWI